MSRLPEEKGRQALAAVLRYGAMSSTLIMALGLGLMFLEGPAAPLDRGLRPELTFQSLIRFDSGAITVLGILLLLLTPILRIAAAVVTFALERDYQYVLISLGVLAVVFVSIGFAIR